MKKWRVIMEMVNEPAWPFCIATLSTSPLPIPLSLPSASASAHGALARPADRFLNRKRGRGILTRLLVRGA